MGFAMDEPFGAPVEDIRAGVIASAIVNMNRVAPEGEDIEPIGALDFFSWHKKPPPPEPPEETPEVISARIMALLNSKAGRNG